MKKLQRFAIPSLMLISVYTAAQTIGETEASFSSQSEKAVQISAAFVFPSTIENLEQKAADSAGNFQKLTHSNLKTLSLTDLLDIKKEIRANMLSLHNIQTELHHYKSKAAANPKEYPYVLKGSEQVDKLISKLNTSSLLSHIDQQIADSQKKQQAELQKKKTKETTPTPVEDEEKKEATQKEDADTTVNDKSTLEPNPLESQSDTGGND